MEASRCSFSDATRCPAQRLRHTSRRDGLQYPFARRDAAQVRVAHANEDVHGIRLERGQGFLELFYRPFETPDEELQPLALSFDGERLVVELARGVAVGLT